MQYNRINIKAELSISPLPLRSKRDRGNIREKNKNSYRSVGKGRISKKGVIVSVILFEIHRCIS